MDKTIEIDNRIIGENQQTYIIAEIGINHNGDFQIAKQMIDEANECGVDCVKFQKRHLPSIYSPEVLANPHLQSIGLGIYIPILKQTELTIEQHFILKEYCESFGMDYLCTPFDILSAEELEHIGVNAFKVASVDLTNAKLITKLVEFKKPLLLSTGMTRWYDIEKVNDRLNSVGAEYMFLHCVSTYPVDFKDVNLKMLDKLKTLHGPVGYSGHERGIEISVCAAVMGASVIERHFTLDRTMKGPDHVSSLEPTGLKKLVEHIRAFELSKGDGIKKITRGEQIIKENLGREPVEVSNVLGS